MMIYRRCRRSSGSRVLPAVWRNTLWWGRRMGWQRGWRNRSDDGNGPWTRTRLGTRSFRGAWSAHGSLLSGLRPKLLSIGRRPKSHTVSLRYLCSLSEHSDGNFYFTIHIPCTEKLSACTFVL